MKLRHIHQLNIAAMMMGITGFASVFLSFVAAIAGTESGFQILFTLGWFIIFGCLALSFAIDRVKCPQCGKPFNRPEYAHWFARHFSKTQPSRTCVHCGHGAKAS